MPRLGKFKKIRKLFGCVTFSSSIAFTLSSTLIQVDFASKMLQLPLKKPSLNIVSSSACMKCGNPFAKQHLNSIQRRKLFVKIVITYDFS